MVRQQKKQIPGGNDRKKGKSNDNDNSNSDGNRRSRFPEGMTERKARATTTATVMAAEEADSRRE
jgi:hypothetical protein